MTDLGDTNSLFLSQRQYILDLLTKSGVLGCQPSKTPIETTTKLSSSGDVFPDAT
jgi:hypothetical protein